MNQGKLEVVKQEMARVNIDISGVSELNGLEWENLTQMTIISTTAGRNPSEEMEWPLSHLWLWEDFDHASFLEKPTLHTAVGSL